MKRIISAFAILLVLLSLLVGCSKEQAPAPAPVDYAAELYGTWSAEVDLADYLKARIVVANEQLKDYLTVSEFKATLTFVFKEDGSYQRSIAGGFPEEELETLRAELKAGYIAYYENFISENELDMTIAQFEKTTGVSLDSKVEQVADPAYLEGLVADLNFSGVFLAEKGVLYFSTHSATDKKEISHKFAVKNGVLTLSACSAPADFEEAFYPLTLKSVKK